MVNTGFIPSLNTEPSLSTIILELLPLEFHKYIHIFTHKLLRMNSWHWDSKFKWKLYKGDLSGDFIMLMTLGDECVTAFSDTAVSKKPA